MPLDETIALVCGNADDKDGLYSCRVGNEGGLQQVEWLPITDPLFLTLHPNGDHCYVTTADGTVVSVEVNAELGTISELDRQSTSGQETCHISIDHTGSYAFTANYASGSITTFPIAPDGQLGEAVHVRNHNGSSVHSERQTASHPHSVGTGPENRYVYVPDLGADRIWVYEFDDEDGSLEPAATPFVETREGAGPRHFEFRSDGRFLYVVNELDSTVTVFERAAETGALTAVDVVSTLPKTYDDKNYCADIHIHPSNKWVYASNRGNDSVAVFSVDKATGHLALAGHESTCGEWPRDIALDPSGRHLFVENQHTNTVVPFTVNDKSGLLQPTNGITEIPGAICMAFLMPN